MTPNMTPLAAAYDNIRLIRRKIRIAQEEIGGQASRSERDAAIMQLSSLTDDLVTAVQDFADAGFEEQVAGMLSDHADLIKRAMG